MKQNDDIADGMKNLLKEMHRRVVFKTMVYISLAFLIHFHGNFESLGEIDMQFLITEL